MRKRQFDLCDTPHPRYGCTIFPFSEPPCLSNGSHCSKCWCFFCEEAAPCSQWGSGIMPTDHCNAVASSWIWPTQKFAREEDPNEEHSVMALPPRPSSMSGLSHGLYGPNFYSLPLSTGIRQVDEQRLLHESSAESDCFSSCQSSLVSARPRTDPSTDAQWFEFGTVWIPIEATQPERTVDDLSCSMDKFSLEFFVQNLRENGMIRLYQDDSVEDFFFNSLHQTTHNYKGLLDEIILNEAQGQLQVILSFTSHPENGRLGMANVRIFLKKERGEELLIMKELLREMFPHDFALQQYLVQVEEMRVWAENSTEWMSFAGLLRDLDSADYRDAPQPSGLSVPLRPYQLQSLQFMLDAEQRSGGLLGVNYHPLQSAANGGQLMYSASLSHLMEYRQGNIHGGFLCEEMGLGKTIEILALILSNPCPIENSTLPSLSKGTLIVCPVSIVGQWANEVKSKLAANLSIYMYHGSKRIRDPKKLAKYDIVITTYATLGSDFSKATQATRHGADFAEQFCPLLSVNWWRVVLDESHTVKDPAPLHSRACARLKADRRWCCTGTPINTSIYDLYGQFLFLKMEPLDNKGIFKRRIGRPYERRCKNDDQTALLWTLNKIMIRHTKQQKFNGRELLRLPPKTEQDIPVSFTAEERAAYEVAYQKAIAKFEQFRCWGPTVVSKNILHIMSLLLPLRRLCSGGFISHDELNSMEKREAIHIGMTETISGSMQTPADTNDLEGECAICFELMECPTKTPCGHWFCCECIISTIGIGGMSGCPVCKLPITTNDLVTYSKGPSLQDPAPAAEVTASSEDDGTQINGVHMESKLRTLLADLAMVREENEGAKVLIFSQFMQTIAWLRAEFKKQGINYRFISGDMPMKKRSQAIEAFQKDSPTTVFLLSIRTGAVGITLTAASHVYMLEPCLNPALEEQAVGRCWRMGQERPVVIKRLFVENSVEANIMKLIRSRNITSLPICAQDSESAVNRSKLRKNNIADVAGCIRTDKQNLRLSEFEVLFSCEK